MPAFMAVAVVGLGTVHLLVSRRSVTAAWLSSALSLATTVQIALLIRGLVKLPTEINDQSVHVRHLRAGASRFRSVT